MFAELRRGGLPRRDQPENHAGNERQRKRECEDPPVQGAGHPERSGARHDSEQPPHRPGGANQAKRRAGDRRDEAFHDQLPHQPEAARAHRQANGGLLLPARGPRQKKAGQVGAGDQQEQPHNRHQNAQRPAELIAEVGDPPGGGSKISGFPTKLLRERAERNPMSLASISSRAW